MRQPRSVTCRMVHPLTGAQVTLRATTRRALEAYRHRLETLREDWRQGLKTDDEIDRAFRRAVHGVVRLQRAASAYTARKDLSPNTRRRVESFVRGAGAPLIALPLEALEAKTLKPWLEALAAASASSTVRQHWKTLRAIVRYAAERGWVGRSPWGAWRPRLAGRGGERLPREFLRTVGDVVRLLAAARSLDDEHDVEREASTPLGLEAKIACATLAGAIQSELAGLRWPDVDAARGLVTIRRRYDREPRKGADSILVIEGFFEVLARHADRLRAFNLFDAKGPVFPGPDSTPGRPRPYARGEVLSRRSVRTAAARADLPNVQRWSAHSLRDSFVTLEAKAHAGDPGTLQTRTRHRSLASLHPYLRAGGRSEPAPPGFDLPRPPGGDEPPPAAPAAALPIPPKLLR